MATKKKRESDVTPFAATQARALDAPVARDAVFTFDDLINIFFTAVIDEGLRVVPPLSIDPNRAVIEPLLRAIYKKRYDDRVARLPANTPDYATLLGRIAAVMVRSELRSDDSPLFPTDVPIDGPSDTQVPILLERHIKQAREMYGHYVNTKQLPPPVNKILGPVQLPGDKGLSRETNEPCPFCG